MKEFIYSRNAVYETLRAKRRQVFRLEVAQGVQEKGRMLDILQMARDRKIPILSAPRIGLTFLVPVAFAVTVPAEALTGRLTPLTLLGAFGLTVLLMALARFVWRLGVRSYSGASA